MILYQEERGNLLNLKTFSHVLHGSQDKLTSDIVRHTMRAIENVETEIRKEKAESLGRTGERFEQILVEVRTLREQLVARAEGCLAGTGGEHAIPAEIQEGLTKYADLCGRARDIRYQLIVQREAVGFRRQEEVDRHYPMPAPATLAQLVGREISG